MSSYLPTVFGENLMDVFDDFDRNFFRGFGNIDRALYGKHAQNMMKTDVKETDEGYEVDVDLPGFQKDEIHLEFEDNAAVCVVLASDGYPVSYEKGFVIHGLKTFKEHEGYYCFHAGTKRTDAGIVTNGGRVLGVTAKGENLKAARANAYKATEWVQFENKYMRHDIGKAIDEA